MTVCSCMCLLKRITRLESWMNQYFLSLNDSKTEVIVFGDMSGSLTANLGSLNEYLTPHATNLRVKVDSELRLDKQMNWVVNLRQPANVKPILYFPLFETVIRAFINNRLDYCNSLYEGTVICCKAPKLFQFMSEKLHHCPFKVLP